MASGSAALPRLTTIGPFKGLAVGVFLISVGMSLDILSAGSQPLLVLGAAGCVVLLKLPIVAALSRAFGDIT
jgi:monovalent cation:H+ antiporter-2, CPA2 family